MQLDMHYYGTYAMARAAGIKQDAAKIIATSAQFVDDNVAGNALEFKDGARIDCEATAHHLATLKNLYAKDQRRVWVPFHFLPGNIGDNYTERLKCRKNSDPAQEMVKHHLGLSNRRFACELMGIAAHVYADTFSHDGFSGVSSRGNYIDSSSINVDVNDDLDPAIKTYITDKAKEFFKNESDSCKLPNIIEKEVKGFWLKLVNISAETVSGGLGHGPAATYPDRPYLVWQFEYERDDAEAKGRISTRNNKETFLEGCRALHGMFEKFIQAPDSDYSAGDGRDFSDIEDTVKDVLAVQADKNGRIEKWKKVAEEGGIFGPKEGESIPDYDGESWNEEWESFHKKENYSQAIKSQVWRFYRAAAIHRTYVLRDLLPHYDLVVD